MEKWEVIFTRQAVKDYELIKAAGLSDRVRKLAAVLEGNPFQNPPPYEKLVGNLEGKYSRRINIHHRLVYSVDQEHRQIKVLRLWTHYER